MRAFYVPSNFPNSYYCEMLMQFHKFQKPCQFSHMGIIRRGGKPAKRLIKSLHPSRLSVRTHETSPERIYRFWSTMILDDFTKNCRTISIFIYIGNLLTTLQKITILWAHFVIYRNTLVGNTRCTATARVPAHCCSVKNSKVLAYTPELYDQLVRIVKAVNKKN
jgi:hypothetical protein